MLASVSGLLELCAISLPPPYPPSKYFEIFIKITDSQTEMLPDLQATLKTNHYAVEYFMIAQSTSIHKYLPYLFQDSQSKLQMPSLFSTRPVNARPFASSGWVLGEILPLPNLTLTTETWRSCLSRSTVEGPQPAPGAPSRSPPQYQWGYSPKVTQSGDGREATESQGPDAQPREHRLFPEADSTPFLTLSQSCGRFAT